ncbi:hypothetical protein FHS46_004162 [Variibacter gotjawalensis]|nr:hypothetical protein [Variibacter gotjawalensis]NIK49782.1 hypothetical protein [Variibacter gotjawalensis]
MEQDSAKFFFEVFDVLRQRRLRHVQSLGGTAEVQLVGHSNETAERSQIHRNTIFELV